MWSSIPSHPSVHVPATSEQAPIGDIRQVETDRKARNAAATAAAKTKYNAKYKAYEERKIGGLSVDDADDKAVSSLYNMLVFEGRRQLVQLELLPYVQLSELEFHELSDCLDHAFLVERNITVERVNFLSRQRHSSPLQTHDVRRSDDFWHR